MKKLFLMLAVASMSVAAMAQDADPTEKYSVSTNSFWSNWFISADVSYGAFYSFEENGAGYSKSPLKDFRRNLGASVAIGKWFTPGLGLRTKVNGIWGRHIVSEDAKTNAVKYWNAQEQILFNLSNMLCGYSETRLWNFIPYVGVGVLRNMDENIYAHGFSAGIMNTWKISKRLMINLDLGLNVSDDDWLDNTMGHQYYGTSFSKTDRYFSAEVGLTLNLGKATWDKTPDVDAIKALSQGQIDALNAQLSDAQSENARLKDLVASQEAQLKEAPQATNAIATQTVTKVVAAPVSVFFNIGKSKIASKKDLQNVSDLTKVAKDSDSKIVVTGYADSKTGSAEFNKQLSQKRAEAVADELVKMGVDRNQIEVVAAGGVDHLSPISYNRRATVELKK